MATTVTPQTAQRLLKAIEADCSKASELLTLLREEKNCLEQRQFVAHQTLNKTKTQLLVALDQADQERRGAMQEMGFDTSRDGFENFLNQVPETWQKRFRAAREKLADNMNACARLNRVNAKILAHAQSSMDRLMNLLRGTQQQVSVYQANGRKQLDNENRMLAMA